MHSRITMKIAQKALAYESTLLRDQIKKHGTALSIKQLRQEPTEDIFRGLVILSSERADCQHQSRALHLARTYLKGKPRNYCEQKTPPDFIRQKAWFILCEADELWSADAVEMGEYQEKIDNFNLWISE